ncbi:Pantothenate:Na+ symporter [Klebsiella pneumoniae]|nr:Pantothenate:Na+ symporter [Klebsiella pneumoniae]
MNSHVFLVGFIIYALAMIWLGWYVSRHQKSGEDFLLGGRSLPLFLTLGSTVATMVGTGSSMGAVGFGYSNGWAGMLYGVGGAIGILLVAWLFAPVRKLRFMTMSEELSYYTGGSHLIKNLVGIMIFIASIGWLGAHILGGSMYLAWATGINLTVAKNYYCHGVCDLRHYRRLFCCCVDGHHSGINSVFRFYPDGDSGGGSRRRVGCHR